VVINNFHVPRRPVFPAKAQAPLVIDPNTPLTAAVALERFESILRGNSQFIDPNDTIYHGEFAQGHRFDIRESGDSLTEKQRFGLLAAEGSYRHKMLMHYVSIVKR